ncbi:hypothetical protein GCM10027161_32880 [Microbispora hainanensis]
MRGVWNAPAATTTRAAVYVSAEVPARREQRERVPPVTPRVSHPLVRVEDGEPQTRAAQVISQRQPGLPAPDDQRVVRRRAHPATS